MARRFRLWEKKRGGRRTGSRLLAVVSEGTLFAALLLLGSVGCIAVLTAIVIEIPGAAEISSPDSLSIPHHARGYGRWYGLATSLGVLVIGILGLTRTLLHVGTSAERRNAMTQRAAEYDPRLRNSAIARDFPTVPRAANLFDSPGTLLTYRLPVRSTFAWRLLGVALYAMLWSGLTAMVGVYSVQQGRAGIIPWLTAAITVPLLWIAIRAIVRFFAEVLDITGLGPTSAEVSDLPFFPGQRYEVALTQAGWMTLRQLELSLVCEEEATFRQGTDIRTERRTVFEQRCFFDKNIRLQPQSPLERHVEIVLPTDAMHSFQSGSNAITWKLVALGRMKRGASFERSFPLVVFPSPVASTYY